MPEDIRDKPYITHADVVGLNFVNPSPPYVFRRHHRQGLRSHVMEVLHPADLALETDGAMIDGVRHFPKATPRRIFRLFRTRLQSARKALTEIERVKIVEEYLAPDYLARSNEFIVDYQGPEGKELMLCGLQEYVPGKIVDPWNLLQDERFMNDLYNSLCKTTDPSDAARQCWIGKTRRQAWQFVSKIKQMIHETKYIPDLAGLGNLIMTPSGRIKLVDINNISRVYFDTTIRLDDRGYPVCDKSIEALAMFERKILGHPVDESDAIYGTFLIARRMQEVAVLEKQFYQDLKVVRRPTT
jgi:hypothetical protein